MVEIEKKFLIASNSFKSEAYKQTRIIQGYLNSAPERTVRVRIKGDKGYLTIKGKGNSTGMTRFEWEKTIPLTEAESLLQLCEKGKIDKIRYEIKKGNHIYEVDEFSGDNEGLIIAEIELCSEDESFEKPDWLAQEVTGNKRYYNSYLSQFPYKEWKKTI